MNVRRPGLLHSLLVMASLALAVAVPCLVRADAIPAPALESINGLDVNHPSGLGVSGTVVGQSTNGLGQLRGVLGGYGFITTEIGTLGGGYSSISAVNASGTIVGESNLSDNTTNRGFIKTPGGTMQDIGTLGGKTSTATAINNAGVVVGGSAVATGETHGFARGTDGSMTNVGTLGGNYSIANGINAFGLVVGQSNTTGGDMHAYSFTGGTIKDLGTLGGTFSAAAGVNDSGQVVGQSFTTGNAAAHAFLYSGTTNTDLGVANGFTSSAADAINNAGQVVGKLYGKLDPTTGNFTQHAFIYSAGILTDLNTLLPSSSNFVLNEATGIDDQGRIIGTGLLNGKATGFVLTLASPVPEPTTFALFGIIGAIAISRYVRR